MNLQLHEPPMAEDDPMIGQRLGNYDITRKIGQGGMGVVYQARHASLNRLVAIKFLAAQFSADNVYVERFLKEAQAAARLNHPNIISVYDAGVFEEVYYFVMEYVRGFDAARLLDKGEVFAETKAIRLVQRVASALAYAHAEGVVHHDIKPGNLFLTSEGQIKIGDLGLATWVKERGSSLMEPGVAVGTPAYISPEQISGDGSVNSRTDIYSLGATLYHLVTGQFPYSGDTPEEVMSKHVTEPFPWPQEIRPELSEALCHIISKMMAKDVAERFQTMEEVVVALTQIETESATTEPQFDALALEAAASQKTMNMLQKRLQGRTDFPSLAAMINVMSKLAGVGDDTSMDELTEAILSDFSLTNKLLKLVNSAFYSAYAGKIATISRAIMVLGLAQVRNAVVSLMLFENLQNRLMSKEIKETSINNFLSGVIARNVGVKIGLRNKEEAFICSIFHNFGKLLAIFYLPEENGTIRELISRDHLGEQAASHSVLGISYEQLGIRIANEWNFPEQLIFTMHNLPDSDVPVPATAADQLHTVVCFSNALSSLIRNTELTTEARDAAFQELINRFANCFAISIEEIAEILEGSLNELATYAEALDMTLES